MTFHVVLFMKVCRQFVSACMHRPLLASRLVSSPDPMDAAADGLHAHHRYASVGSGETGNKIGVFDTLRMLDSYWPISLWLLLVL